MTPKFGQWVTCTARLYRTSKADRRTGYKDLKHIHRWEPIPIKNEGLFIGTRTLYNGEVEWAEDTGSVFSPKSHFTAALVVPGPRRKPILVPMDAVKIKSTGFEVVEPCKQKNCFDCDGNEWKGRECIKCTGTITRPLTQDEINQKFGEMYEHFINIECEVCPTNNSGDGCIGDECAVYCLLSVDGDPIRKVKP
jgi:hypothetical protein